MRDGIIPRKKDDAKLFLDENVEKWVIHAVIHWMDNINMKKYSKYFADFEQPISGKKLTNYNNIYMFRLRIDFEIEREDALKIIKEIDKLRQFLPGDPSIIDYEKESEWLTQSFDLLAMRFKTNQHYKQEMNFKRIRLK